jgi:hypothetical protein
VAVSLGKNFRRLLAQALAADEDQMRALVERVLPREECGKRVLCPENDDDCQLLPLVIVAALSVDAITGDEAKELKRQAKNAKPIKAPPPWWEDPSPELLRMSPVERIRLGYVRPPEVAFPPWRTAVERSRDAAKSEAAIVNNNKNTMDAGPQMATGQKPNPL